MNKYLLGYHVNTNHRRETVGEVFARYQHVRAKKYLFFSSKEVNSFESRYFLESTFFGSLYFYTAWSVTNLILKGTIL